MCPLSYQDPIGLKILCGAKWQWYMLLIPAEAEAGLSLEFKANRVSLQSSMTDGDTKEPCLKKTKQPKTFLLTIVAIKILRSRGNRLKIVLSVVFCNCPSFPFCYFFWKVFFFKTQGIKTF